MQSPGVECEVATMISKTASDYMKKCKQYVEDKTW